MAPEADARDARYRFVHELIRQTLAESLSLPRRQRLHIRIADGIERVYAGRLEAQASQLAYHLYRAGAVADPEKTTAYLLMAARQARAGSAHEEALENSTALSPSGRNTAIFAVRNCWNSAPAPCAAWDGPMRR